MEDGKQELHLRGITVVGVGIECPLAMGIGGWTGMVEEEEGRGTKRVNRSVERFVYPSRSTPSFP